jgi:hypothetical protein
VFYYKMYSINTLFGVLRVDAGQTARVVPPVVLGELERQNTSAAADYAGEAASSPSAG